MAQLGYINVKDAPYNAKGDGVADDTDAIQEAFDDAADTMKSLPGTTVFIPAGVYMVGKAGTAAALEFKANYCKLTGGGTLKHLVDPVPPNDYNNEMILEVTGNFNFIEWLRIDGNESGGALTNTDGLRVTGNYNRIRNVSVFDIPKSEDPEEAQGGSLQPLALAGRMERCFSDGAYEGLRVGGNFNTLHYCVALNFNVKGYNNNSVSAWTYASGCHVESTTSAASVCGYQTDPGNVKVNGWTTLRDCTATPTFTAGGTTSVCKFSWLKSIYVDGCQFLHTSAYPSVNSVRLAGNVGRCRMKDSFLSREMFFQNAMFPINPNEVRLERVLIGDGVHLSAGAMQQVRCNVLTVSDSVFRNFNPAGIDWDGQDGTYSLITGRNCDFIGNRPTFPSYDIAAAYLPNDGGQLNRTRKLGWYSNRRENTNGVGGGAQFTNVATSEEVLGSTLSGTMDMMAGSSAPDGTHVMWAIGDIILNTSPVSGEYVGWVFTSQAPITWMEW